MPIFSNSRYRTGRVVKIKTTRNGREQTLPFVYMRKSVPTDVDIAVVHKVQGTERLDQIAHKYAGDSRLWWIIADVNRIFKFPLLLPSGTELLIPTVAVFTQYGGR